MKNNNFTKIVGILREMDDEERNKLKNFLEIKDDDFKKHIIYILLKLRYVHVRGMKKLIGCGVYSLYRSIKFLEDEGIIEKLNEKEKEKAIEYGRLFDLYDYHFEKADFYQLNDEFREIFEKMIEENSINPLIKDRIEDILKIKERRKEIVSLSQLPEGQLQEGVRKVHVITHELNRRVYDMLGDNLIHMNRWIKIKEEIEKAFAKNDFSKYDTELADAMKKCVEGNPSVIVKLIKEGKIK